MASRKCATASVRRRKTINRQRHKVGSVVKTIVSDMTKAGRSHGPLFRFLGVGFLGYLAWHLAYTFDLRDHTLMDEYVIHNLVVGVATVHFANYLRVMALMWIQVYWPESLDFNHHYTFTVLVYGVIFLLWYIWAVKIVGDKGI